MKDIAPRPWRRKSGKPYVLIAANNRRICEVKFTSDPNVDIEKAKQQSINTAELIEMAPEYCQALEVIKTVATEPHHENALQAIREIATNVLKGKKSDAPANPTGPSDGLLITLLAETLRPFDLLGYSYEQLQHFAACTTGMGEIGPNHARKLIQLRDVLKLVGERQHQ